MGLFIKVNAKQAITNNFPIRINVFYINSGIVELWNLPDSSDPGYVVKEINRTICFLNEDKNINIEVILTAPECPLICDGQNAFPGIFIPGGKTCCDPFQFKFEIYTTSNNSATLNGLNDVKVQIGSPAYHHVDLSNTNSSKYLNIFINSTDDACGLVSIHPLVCPIPDWIDFDNAENGLLNKFQYMHKNGVLNLNGESGFFIKFSEYASNCKCNPSSCETVNTTNVRSINHKTFTYTILNSNRSINQFYTETVSVEAPVVYHVELDNVKGILQVLVTSDDNQCGTVSIHPIDCQTHECFKDIPVHWQTMFKIGVLTINADDYTKEDGFFIKFTSHASDCQCNFTSTTTMTRNEGNISNSINNILIL